MRIWVEERQAWTPAIWPVVLWGFMAVALLIWIRMAWAVLFVPPITWATVNWRWSQWYQRYPLIEEPKEPKAMLPMDDEGHYIYFPAPIERRAAAPWN